MVHTAPSLLDQLLHARRGHTYDAPKESRGLYGLIDHFGDLRYIGSTSADAEHFYKRIHQRHRSGSEGGSHYFSRMYNTGRMWRSPKDEGSKADGLIAKALRNAFIAQHCRAVWLPLPDHLDIARLEQEVLALAPSEAIAWNRRNTAIYDEPVELVDRTIAALGLGTSDLAAIARQQARFLGQAPTKAAPPAETALAALPQGPFRLVALDVETANNDRSSICQVGLAFVTADGQITTWGSLVDPHTQDWRHSRIHNITAAKVRGAPDFATLLAHISPAMRGLQVWQHSTFDQTAIAAACQKAGLALPNWPWSDSVQLARRVWPELKAEGGHGLAALKQHFNLKFNHHDAVEDARATAQIILMAEHARPVTAMRAAQPEPGAHPVKVLGELVLTAGAIKNGYVSLGRILHLLPQDLIGGSHEGALAPRQARIDYGGAAPVETDIARDKSIFRKRGWIKELCARQQVKPGDRLRIEEVAPYRYKAEIFR